MNEEDYEDYEDYEDKDYDNDDEVYENGEPIGATSFGKVATAGALIGVGALSGVLLPKAWHKVKGLFEKGKKSKSKESDEVVENED